MFVRPLIERPWGGYGYWGQPWGGRGFYDLRRRRGYWSGRGFRRGFW
jgi:hypothetical protein